jgi:DNA-binding GntR family transcriptional regulator
MLVSSHPVAWASTLTRAPRPARQDPRHRQFLTGAFAMVDLLSQTIGSPGGMVSTTQSLKLLVAPSLGDQAYVLLRQRIADGDYNAGQRVTERGLATELGVSPTPVREAIRRLEHERLLERLDGRTLTVVRPSVHRLFELNLIEGALAGVAARLAAASSSHRELAAIRATHNEAADLAPSARTVEEGIEVLRLARQTHQLIYDASHNTQLIDMIATAGVFEWRIRVESMRRLGSSYLAGVGLGDHGGVVEALEARDGARAETLMRDHVTAAAHRHLDVVAEDESLGESL